jgi:transposase
VGKQAVTPNGENATLAAVAVAMEAAPNKRSYIRLGAVRLLLKGVSRATVCEIYQRSDRMLRLWVHRFNQSGIDGLISKPRSGRPRKVNLKRLEDVLLPVLADPQQAGELHWTGVKVHGWLRQQLQVELSYRTVLNYLHELNYVLKVPRRWAAGQDEVQRQAFVTQVQAWQARDEVELWFADECGVEGDPRPRRRWAPRGSCPTLPYQGRHLRANVIGSVCPASGQCHALIFDGVDSGVFQYYLDQLARDVPKDPAKERILIVDNASWHKSQDLDWHHFTPAYLPPYSPDFNPIERLWLRLKADWFSDFIAKTPEELTHRLCAGLKSFFGDATLVASQCAFRK